MEVKQAVSDLKVLFSKITNFLKAKVEKGPATKSLYENSQGVLQFAVQVASSGNISNVNLSTLIGGVSGFSRHLSEIEETVYYELGNEDLETLKSFIEEETNPYNTILASVKQ